jgi:hypothetical protein
MSRSATERWSRSAAKVSLYRQRRQQRFLDFSIFFPAKPSLPVAISEDRTGLTSLSPVRPSRLGLPEWDAPKASDEPLYQQAASSVVQSSDWVTVLPPPPSNYIYPDHIGNLRSLLDLLPVELELEIRSYLEPQSLCPPSRSPLLTECMRRALNKRRQPKFAGRERKEQLELEYDWDVDPLSPPKFVVFSRYVHSIRRQLDRLDRDQDGYDEKCDRLMVQQRTFLGHAFRQFAWASQVPVASSFVFDKADSDRAFQSCFGSYENAPTGRFRLHGMVKPLFLPDDAAEIFSLYLGRKGFVAHDPRNLESARQGFLSDVTSPPPPLSSRLLARQAQMRRLIRRIAKVSFACSNPPRRSTPNSGKACLESSRKEGGKRQSLYTDSFTDEFRGKTKVVAILSAGKIRPITIGSVYNEQYAWLNSFMFNRIRKYGFMVAGKEVRDWASDNAHFSARDPSDLVFLSSDFEKATTLFSGVFAEDVVEVLAECVGLSPDEVDEILSGLTRAVFVEHNEEGDLVEIGRQVRGQNLGSDLSFPILCLVTTIVAIETLGETEVFLDMKTPAFREALKNEQRFGVNGDDLALRVGRDKVPRWIEAGECVGGRVCVAKSPLNAMFWTMNSQLFYFGEAVPFVSPALCLNLCERLKTPQKSWIDQFALTSDVFRKKIGLAHIVLGDVPRSLGGLGESTVGGRFFVRRMEFARLSRSKKVDDFLDDEVRLGMIRRRGARSVVGSECDRPTGRRVTGLVKYGDMQKYAYEIYQLRHIAEWSESNSRYRSFKEISRKIKLRESSRYPLSGLSALEKCAFYNTIDDAGLILIRNKMIYRELDVKFEFAGKRVDLYDV